MSLCESIDTLAMAYLDDELASEERRELETHLHDCNACRAEVEGARADQALIQTSLVAPRMTDTMRMRLVKSLGEEGTLLSYDITAGGRHVVLSLLVIQGGGPEEMQDGEEVDAGGRMVHVIQSNGHNAVTVTDANHRGYMFMADELPIADLISLVGRTSLVGPQ